MVHPLNFLDANCGVGPYYNPSPGHDWSVAGLLAKMDELGIAEACPFCMMATNYDPWEANEWLLNHVPPSQRIHPVWAVATHYSQEFPPPRELIRRMDAHGVRMLRLLLHPIPFHDQLDLPLFVELFDTLDQHRVPLMIDSPDPLQFRASDLEPILERWRNLPVILSIPKVVQNERWFYYLWERYDNFYLDMPGYQVLGGIESIVGRFGPHRLIYGSRYPYFTPLQTMLQVIYSDVDESAKRAIAGDTLRSLLKGVQL